MSIFLLLGFALPQPLWSLKILVYFMCMSLPVGRKQCNTGSCWGPPALPFLGGIVPQNQGLQSIGVTWTRLELALGILPCVCVAISKFGANTDIWACSCSSFPSGSSGQSPSFPCCGHSRCLQSHSLHQHHPRNCCGHHISCKALLFSREMLPEQVLLPADFSCPRSWGGLTLWLSLGLTAGSDAFRAGCRSWNPHTAPGRGRNTCGCVQLWCYQVTKAIYLIVWWDHCDVISRCNFWSWSLPFECILRGLLGFLLGTGLRPWERDDRRCHRRSVPASVFWWGATTGTEVSLIE